MEDLYGDPVNVWRAWTTNPVGGRIDSGHHMAEDAPDELASTICQFLD